MFLHRYALAISCPVPILRLVLDSQDIDEAMAYETMEPFGDSREDVRWFKTVNLFTRTHIPLEYLHPITDEDKKNQKIKNLFKVIKKESEKKSKKT